MIRKKTSVKENLKNKAMGRPPKDNPASETLPRVRVTPDKLEAYKSKARKQGQSFSEWIRSGLDAALKSKN